MNSNKELKVILSKVKWCGHCTDFLPIFNKSQEFVKKNKILKNVKVNFEVYDMEEDAGLFKTKYEDLVDQIKGYPTVFVTQIEDGKRIKTVDIDYSDNPEIFIENISKTYNKLTQNGGFNEEELYKQKYLKYKAKYIQLKAELED